MIRDTIFISHATPQDNEFTIWLASRLELAGYKVWIDKNELLGGEAFWDEIEDTIKNKAVKVLLVYSKNIIDESKILKSGVQKELNFVSKALSLNPEIKDFLIPLHLDDSPRNFFDGSKDLNQIQFNGNWGEGLGVLVKKLEKDYVPKFDGQTQNSFSSWYLENYLIKNPVIQKKELYYSNWWSVDSFPEQFYIYRFSNEDQAKAVHEANKETLNTINANCITTFEKNLTFRIIHENEPLELKPDEIHEIKISDLLLGYEREAFPTKRDAENYFKKLFKRAIHNLFKSKKLFWSELANKNQAYYHTPDSLPSSKVNFIYPYRKKGAKKKKSKKLYGKYLTLGKWHFALSIKPILTPYLGFAARSHIIFTDRGYKAWEDKNLIHAHRRKKGRRMFNEEWRDLLLGFIESLKNEDKTISIVVSENNSLIMKSNLESFWSDHGYFDPKDKMRQNIFIYEDDDEVEEDINEVIEPESDDH